MKTPAKVKPTTRIVSGQDIYATAKWEAKIRWFVNGVMFVLRTSTPWRDLPPGYGEWNSVWRRAQAREMFLSVLQTLKGRGLDMYKGLLSTARQKSDTHGNCRRLLAWKHLFNGFCHQVAEKIGTGDQLLTCCTQYSARP